MDTEIAKSPKVKPDDVPAEDLLKDHDSIGNGAAGELLSLDHVDRALAAKMHLVNDVCLGQSIAAFLN
jgi:hypothetical protein